VSGKKPRVVIVGAGFGGLAAANALGGKDVDVLVVDRNNYHGFWPFLYQVATSQLEEEAIAYPVRAALRRHRNVDFRMADVKTIDLDRRYVIAGRDRIPYDYLILAAGSETNFFGNEQLERHAYGLKDVEQAHRLRNHILAVFEAAAAERDIERRRALLSFVIVGAGPTGCELAGSLAQLIRAPLTKDFPTLDLERDSQVVLVQGGGTVLPPFPEKLRNEAHGRLERLGVQVRTGTVVDSVENGVVTFSDGSTAAATTVIWTAGVRAADLVGRLGLETGSLGRVKVMETLSVPGHPEAFAIGDVMHLEGFKAGGGGPYPMVAQVAIQGGKLAAKNVLALVAGKEPQPFRYFDKGQMAIIGKRAAIVDAFGMRLRGTPAWLAWLFLHILYLVGFRNRLLVLVDWLSDITHSNQGVRVITLREFSLRVAELHEHVLDHRRRTGEISILSADAIADALEARSSAE
jgi:NADH dehydrogenase